RGCLAMTAVCHVRHWCCAGGPRGYSRTNRHASPETTAVTRSAPLALTLLPLPGCGGGLRGAAGAQAEAQQAAQAQATEARVRAQVEAAQAAAAQQRRDAEAQNQCTREGARRSA